MYLKIGETQYTCTNRIKSASGTLKFLGVSPAPVEVSGTIQIHELIGEYFSAAETGTEEPETPEEGASV